jgi:hypothetical protein
LPDLSSSEKSWFEVGHHTNGHTGEASVWGPHRPTALRTASSVIVIAAKEPNGSVTSQRQISVKPVAPQKTPTNKARQRCASVSSLGFPGLAGLLSDSAGNSSRTCSSNQPTSALCDESNPDLLAER